MIRNDDPVSVASLSLPRGGYGARYMGTADEKRLLSQLSSRPPQGPPSNLFAKLS